MGPDSGVDDSAIGTRSRYGNRAAIIDNWSPGYCCPASNTRGMITAMLGKCANPECNCEFKRLGTGRIYSLQVRDPERWGLPAHMKQKVVWLCAKCNYMKEVRFDCENGQVLLVN